MVKRTKDKNSSEINWFEKSRYFRINSLLSNPVSQCPMVLLTSDHYDRVYLLYRQALSRSLSFCYQYKQYSCRNGSDLFSSCYATIVILWTIAPNYSTFSGPPVP